MPDYPLVAELGIAAAAAVAACAALRCGGSNCSKAPAGAVLITRHAERVDYDTRQKGGNWQASAERPWDTPITAGGVLQAEALGRAIKRRCAELGLPPLTRVFCSPLVRCVQTAAALCDTLDPPTDGEPSLRICVEPSLRETSGEDWFRSWAVPGANGTWGGPETCRAGVEPASLRPEAETPSNGSRWDWLTPDTPELTRRVESAEAGSIARAAARLDAGYQPFSFGSPMGGDEGFSWGSFESEEMQVARLGRFFDHVSAAYPTETVLLVSHGGPSASLFRHTQRFQPPASGWKVCKFCGLYAVQRAHRSAGEDAEWTALLEADHEHLAEVPSAAVDGLSSALEQAK